MTARLFQQIMKSLPRRKIRKLAATLDGDKWCKSLSPYDHLVTMIHARLAGQTSLRDVEASFDASPARHHHPGSGGVRRSTLGDANAQRPCGVLEAILQVLLEEAFGRTGRQVGDIVRPLGSTTIALLAKTHRTLRHRFNNSALKLHMMLDPDAEMPTWFQITPARFHDSKVRDSLSLEAGTTHVLDRACNNAGFRADVEAADAFFVTRPRTDLAFDVEASRHHHATMIVADETIRLARNPGRKHTMPLRRIEIFDEQRGEEVAFITNDFDRDPQAIADLCKRRWQIETFFKWIKQNLRMKRFLARNPKAIRLQIVTALIPHVLLHQFHQANRLTIPLKRLAALVGNHAFNSCATNELIRPPRKPPDRTPSSQLAINFPGQQ